MFLNATIEVQIISQYPLAHSNNNPPICLNLLPIHIPLISKQSHQNRRVLSILATQPPLSVSNYQGQIANLNIPPKAF
jgi:hypothetical protein